MRAAVLLDLDDVTFIEPAYERLVDDIFTQMLVSMPGKKAKLLISEDEWPLALAVFDGRTWKAGSFLLRTPNEQVIERAELLEADILQEERTEWEAAVREYYSMIVAKEVVPAIEDFTPARALQVADLLRERWGDTEGEGCIDACCGSGIGSVALRDVGMIAMSFDNDPSLLSLGLRTGRLLPEDTMCIDGTRATSYLKHAHFGVILMAGKIGPHNQIVWHKILSEMLELTEHTLVTLETENEGQLVASWARERNRKVELLQNHRDPFYDGWVCDIRRV